jgi:EAL domain-containing protein (putative c-di-GMP-specific phosphodiesterase class I)
VPPERLIVDVTEEASHTDYDHILDAFTRLRLLGVGLTLDNFGTGYSSLTELCRMPFTEVKVDRSLIAELPYNHDAGVIAEAVAGLAHKLGLRACAAGVETVGALQALRAYGYDAVQGRAICEPITAAQLDALSREWRGPIASTEVLAAVDTGSRAQPIRRPQLARQE